MDRNINTEPIRIISAGPGVGPFAALNETTGAQLSCYRIPEGADLRIVREGLELSLGISHRSYCRCLGIQLIEGQHYICESRPGLSLAEALESGTGFSEVDIVWFLHSLLNALGNIHNSIGEAHGNLDPHTLFLSSPTNRRLMIGGAVFWRRLLDLEKSADAPRTDSVENDFREALRLGLCLATQNTQARLDELKKECPPRISPALWSAMNTVQHDIAKGIKELESISGIQPSPVGNLHPTRLSAKLAKHHVFNGQNLRAKKHSRSAFHWIEDVSRTADEETAIRHSKETLRLETERLGQLDIELKAKSGQLDERELLTKSKDEDQQQRSFENERKARQLRLAEENLKNLQTELETKTKRIKLDQETHLTELARFEVQKDVSLRKDKEAEANLSRTAKQHEELAAKQNEFRLERESWQQRVIATEAENRKQKLQTEKEIQNLRDQGLELARKTQDLVDQQNQLETKTKALQLSTQKADQEALKRAEEFRAQELAVAKAQKEAQALIELEKQNRNLSDQLAKARATLQRDSLNNAETITLSQRIEVLTGRAETAEKESLRHLQTISEKDREISILNNQNQVEKSQRTSDRERYAQSESTRTQAMERQNQSLRQQKEEATAALQLIEARNRELSEKIATLELELQRTRGEAGQNSILQRKIAALEKQASESAEKTPNPADSQMQPLREKITFLETELQRTQLKLEQAANLPTKRGVGELDLRLSEKEAQKARLRPSPDQPPRPMLAYALGAALVMALIFAAFLGLRNSRLQRQLAIRPAISSAGSVVVIASPRAELLIDGLEPQSTPTVLRDLAPGVIHGKLRSAGKEDKLVEIKVPDSGIAVSEFTW